jgi:hypothetical protein
MKLNVFIPPEWDVWNWIERVAYSVSLFLFMVLMGIGATTVYGWVMGGPR